MIVDHMENIVQYPQLQKYAEEMTGFIEKCRLESLPAGRYELLPDGRMFALLQCYETKSKEDARMESHINYADLQYILEGREIIYYDLSRELAAEEDRTVENDIIFYRKQQDKGGCLLTAGMFGYYAPQDAHMPCVRCGEAAEKVTKIVFKIRIR